jgi:hypothetical protein
MDREAEILEAAAVKRDMQDLKNQVDRLEKSVKELVDAWNTAGGIVKAVKWASGVAVALSAAWAVLKGHFVL